MIFKRSLIIILILLFIVVFFVCLYLLLKDYFELKENNKLNENLIEESIVINEETQNIVIDWDYLKSINADIIGWIEIEGTNINYPILQDSNNYYLKHSFDKTYNSNGSIFTTNKFPFDDEETIIYGHNMKNGSMLSSLGNYMDEEFFNSHFKLKIYTPSCNYEGTIFSAYSTGVENESNNLKNLTFSEKIEYYHNSSKFSIKDYYYTNKIVKLSTCSYINAKTTPTDQRYYIIAYLFPTL